MLIWGHLLWHHYHQLLNPKRVHSSKILTCQCGLQLNVEMINSKTSLDVFISAKLSVLWTRQLDIVMKWHNSDHILASSIVLQCITSLYWHTVIPGHKDKTVFWEQNLCYRLPFSPKCISLAQSLIWQKYIWKWVKLYLEPWGPGLRTTQAEQGWDTVALLQSGSSTHGSPAEREVNGKSRNKWVKALKNRFVHFSYEL